MAMTTPEAATVGAALRATLALPVTIGLLVPILLIAVDPWRRALEGPSLAIGAVMGITGAAMVGRTTLDLFRHGQGTLAPWDPPRRLVTTGLFAHCRNPLYLGVLAVLAGLAMASRSPLLGIYLLSAAGAFHARVIHHEEPWADRTFPDRWPAYRDRVPRWFPRMVPPTRADGTPR